MGLASEMRWPHSRNGSTPHQAVDGPAALPIRVSDEWAVNDEYWAILMLRVGALVIIVFQSGYLLNELESLDYWPATLGLHLSNIVFACVALGASFNAGLARHWRGIVLATSCAVIGGTTAISLIRHEDVPLFITALLFSMGTGCLIPWNERWQAALNIFALAAFALDEALIPAHDPYLYYRWLGMLNGVTIAQLSAYLAGVYRRGLAARYEELARSERRTADGETKLRKIFESTSDSIAIFRVNRS